MQQVVGVALLDGSRVLAAHRPSRPGRAGGWEFPGGKVEPGEEPATTAVREVEEELGVAVEVVAWLPDVVPIDDRLELLVCVARQCDTRTPVPTEHDELRWVDRSQLGAMDRLEPDQPHVARLEELTCE